MIPEARADLRSELPAACGGLSALQRPQPHVLVSGRKFDRSLFLAHLPDESRACAARKVSAARAWVANQVQNGRSVPMRSMLPESRRHGHGQWPRWSARMNWEHALAWACRLAAGAIDRRGERRPWSSNPLVRVPSCSHARFRGRAGGRPARGGDYWELRQRLLGASGPRRTRAGCFEAEIGARSSAKVVGGLHWCEHRGVWTEDTAGARKTGQVT